MNPKYEYLTLYFITNRKYKVPITKTLLSIFNLMNELIKLCIQKNFVFKVYNNLT